MKARLGTPLCALAVLAAAALFAGLLFARLTHPLLWHDEADTAVFAERVRDHGVPMVRGEPTLLYDLRRDRIDPESGVYRGGVWGAYYFGALGVALARGSDDLYARTARLRLPFAALGFASVLLVGLGLAPSAGAGRSRRLGFLALFTLASAYSISLILHLREVRYYSLALCLVGALVVLHVERQIRGRLRFAPWCAGSALCLFALFNVFPPAFGALGLAQAVALGLGAARAREPAPARLRALLREGSALALGLALVLPVAFGFELFELAEGWVRTRSSAARSYTQNLAFVGANLLRYEFLAPAVLAQLGVLAAQAARRGAPLEPALRRRLAVPRFLLLVALVYVLLLCRKPLLWERYFVPLSPLLSAAFLLDACALADLARAAAAGRRARRVARSGLAALAAVCLGLAWLRLPELRGRFAEIRTPVAGPLDHFIPYLAARHADPARLVIATNYEGAAYTWYLRSHVIVGFYGGNLEEDMRLVPDVIVPRRWPRLLPELRKLAARGSYTPVYFPVRSQPTNGTPSLWPGSLGGVHEFRAQPPASDAERAYLLERLAP